MHKPSKFGDNLADIRYSFRYTNSTKKIASGFERGRTTHAFRNVYPIFDTNNNHIASVEISFTSDWVQDYFTKIGRLHTHFLVHKDIFDEKLWEKESIQDNYIQSIENSDYFVSVRKGNLEKEKMAKMAKNAIAINITVSTS